MPRLVRHGTVVLFLASVVTLPSGCAEVPPEGELLRPVRTQRVSKSRANRVRSFSGTARAGQETDLSFRVSGRIEALHVDVGDTVRAGQVIAQLEQEDFAIAVGQAQARHAQEIAQARNAGSDLDRIRGLYENDNASKNDLDAALAQAQAAQAQVEAAAQALEAARRQRAYTSLRAPVGGAIASVPVEVNENVVQGQTVVRMTSGSRLEVEVAIPEILIAQIGEGDPVSVVFDAIPGTTFDAVVTEVGVASIVTATTFPVKVRLSVEGRDVRSGMAANVAFRFAAEHVEHFHLPSHAVGGDRDGKFVYIVQATEEKGVVAVRRTAVEIGELTGEGLEILSGLSEGQQVVTAGVRRLSDGQRVKLLDGVGERP